MAGEHFLGEIGNAILTPPELLDGVDPRIAGLLRWHGYEEVEPQEMSARGSHPGTIRENPGSRFSTAAQTVSTRRKRAMTSRTWRNGRLSSAGF
jgi:hypothetical protein